MSGDDYPDLSAADIEARDFGGVANAMEVVGAYLLDQAWLEGYRAGYESPDMPIDYVPMSPWSPDRTEQDA